jgi:hypothetical protein
MGYYAGLTILNANIVVVVIVIATNIFIIIIINIIITIIITATTPPSSSPPQYPSMPSLQPSLQALELNTDEHMDLTIPARLGQGSATVVKFHFNSSSDRYKRTVTKRSAAKMKPKPAAF